MSAIKGVSDATNQEHFKLLVLHERPPEETTQLVPQCFIDALTLWSPVLSVCRAAKLRIVIVFRPSSLNTMSGLGTT
jgi:hypothetical protein